MFLGGLKVNKDNKGCIVTYGQVTVLPLMHLLMPTQAYD